MKEKYYDDVLSYITEHGESGVNEISKALNVPLATMQRYLIRQTYFRKTVNRKWDLPHNVESDIKSNTMTLMVNSVENALLLVDSQMAEVQQAIQNALMPVNTLKRAVDMINLPVADNSGNIDKRLTKIAENSQKITDIIKKQKSNIPDEYSDVLLNLDYVGLVLAMGETFTEELLGGEVYGILAGKDKELSEEALETLKQYQREA